MCWSLVMWLQTYWVPASARPSVEFPPAGSGAFPLATGSSCKIKKSLERWQLGWLTESPGGPGLGDLPPSISWRCSASPSPPSESKQQFCSVVVKAIPALCVTLHLVSNFSFSISHLSVLIWHSGSRLHTSSPVSYGPRGRWSASKPLKYSDTQTPKSRIGSLGLKAPGSGGDPWQSRRVAATLGPRLHGLLGANSTVFHKHFL